MKLQNQTAVKIEPQYGLAAIDAYLESEAAATKFTLSLSAAKSKLWSSAEAAASSAKAWPLSLSAIGKTRSRQAAAPWAEGLRPIPNSQPENKNSPRQLESEAGLTHGTPRPVSEDSRRGGPPSIREPCWTTTMCCLRTASHHLSQAGLQSNQRDSAPAFHVSTGASREPQTLSRELRAITPKPRGRLRILKKNFPSVRTRSRARKESRSGRNRDLVRRRGAHRLEEQDHKALRQTRSVCSGVSRRHHRNPAQARKLAGQDSGGALWCSSKPTSFWIFLLLVCHQRKALSRRRKSAPTGFVSKHAVLRLVRLVVWQSE